MKSQQKCVVIFALVCCFAVLVALIFSAVDIWGGDEDGITEDNCSTNCRIVLVENIPEDITFSENGTSSIPLSVGLHKLLDMATRSVEIVSSHWALTSADLESGFPGADQGQYLFQRLLDLKSHQISLKVASGLTNSSELRRLLDKGADVRYLNMSALTRGHLHSTFWVVDRQHIYIGSANMDWRSLSKMRDDECQHGPEQPNKPMWPSPCHDVQRWFDTAAREIYLLHSLQIEMPLGHTLI